MEKNGEIHPAKKRKSNKKDDLCGNIQDESRYDDDSNGNNIYSQQSSVGQYQVCMFIFLN
jgi:hypothetical protein